MLGEAIVRIQGRIDYPGEVIDSCLRGRIFSSTLGASAQKSRAYTSVV